MEVLHSLRISTPVGEVLGVSSERGLCGLYLNAETAGESLDLWRRRYSPASMVALDAHNDPTLESLVSHLSAYFDGQLRSFELGLDPRGTEFQREVWEELRRIPYGRTISYGELAKRLGRPGGSRAVGAANGANPLPIVVPCHRVVAANGLGGFSGGLDRKLALLRLEGVLLPVSDN